MAAVLKTVLLKGNGGSNPSSSAIVTIRKNDGTDAKYEMETEGLSLETNRTDVTIFFFKKYNMSDKLILSLNHAEMEYKNFMSKHVHDYENSFLVQNRVNQIQNFKDLISQHFNFDEINLIETGVSGNVGYGLFGFFLGSLVHNYGGRMASVDTDCVSCEQSEKIFSENFHGINYKTYCMDSIEFLKRPPFIPNIVHLDSYDLDLFNPFPSTLHHWKEFESIQNLIPKGGIILIDDNWMKDTNLQWVYPNSEIWKTIEYPIFGKGANIYNEVLSNRTDFELIGNHYFPGNNIKIYIKKIN